MPSWLNIKLIYLREIRDQLRDRRTLFTIAVLPIFLYPMLGMSILQVTQFMRGKPIRVLVVGADHLPAEPRLLLKTEAGFQFAPEFMFDSAPESIELTVKPGVPDDSSLEHVEAEAQKNILQDKFDTVLYVPPQFSEQLVAFRNRLVEFQAAAPGSQPAPEQFPGPQAIPEPSREKSVLAALRIKRILDDWCQVIGRQNLERSNLPAIVTVPFKIDEVKGPEKAHRQAMLWSKILPFVALIWALTGAFYPAIDLCAGEKERGTLETLLSSPALRSEIVWGKLLTVMSFSLVTSLLNLLSLTATGSFIVTRLESLSASGVPLGPPPFAALGWLALTLIPISALFSALSLAIASFAKSSKEGQYYLMPLLLICLPLMMLPMPSSSELNLGTSLIPITGVVLLLRALIEGHYLAAATFAPPVIGVTVIGCLLSIRWAIAQFNNESVLFRESERWELGAWLRHLLRDRDTTPTYGMAILCGVMLLMIRFFAGFMIGEMPQNWNAFATSTMIFQVGLIAVPALLMTFILTRSFRQTMSLKFAHPLAIPAAMALAFFIHPAGMAVTEAFVHVYPMNSEMTRELMKLEGVITNAPGLWAVLLVMALTPAICEELAFRGFILSGLRRSGDKWQAILVSAVFFGATHGILQQSLQASVLGVVLGFLAIQTGSLLPAVAFHLSYNSLSIFLKLGVAEYIGERSVLAWFYQKQDASFGYNPIFTGLGFIIAIGLLYWFRSLPYQATAEEQVQEMRDLPALPAVAK